jgi:hypothetical protein
MEFLDTLPGLIASVLSLLSLMAKKWLLKRQIKEESEIRAAQKRRKKAMEIKPQKPPPKEEPPAGSDMPRVSLRCSPSDIC